MTAIQMPTLLAGDAGATLTVQDVCKPNSHDEASRMVSTTSTELPTSESEPNSEPGSDSETPAISSVRQTNTGARLAVKAEADNDTTAKTEVVEEVDEAEAGLGEDHVVKGGNRVKFPQKHELTPHPHEVGWGWYCWNVGIYTWINCTHILLVWAIYSMRDTGYWTPQMLALHMAVAYSFEQVTFAWTHLAFHTIFAERFGTFINRPNEFNYVSYTAWVHHYVDIKKFTTHWLQYRTSYFDFWHSTKQMYANGPIVVAFSVLLFQMVYYGETRSTFLIDCHIGMAWRHIQGIVHEYYHVPRSTIKANKYFTLKPVGWMFAFFEKIGMIECGKHKLHHKDDRIALTAADEFFDMWVPSFFDKWVSSMWFYHIKKAQPMELIGSKYLCVDETERPGTVEDGPDSKFKLWYSISGFIAKMSLVNVLVHGAICLWLQTFLVV